MGVYVPGTTEADQKKQNRSLQQLGAATEGVKADVTAAQTDIAVLQTLVGTALQEANNLSDVASASTSLTNLAGVSYASQTLTSAQQTQARSNISAAIAPTVLTNSLTADVAVSKTALTDGPSVAQGTVGQWEVSGTVTFLGSAGSIVFVRLWDGTTTVASTGYNGPAAAARQSVSLSGVITNPAGNLRFSAQEQNGATTSFSFSSTGYGKDCTITAIRIA